MRMMSTVVLCLSASVLLIFGSCLCEDPVAEPEISFSVPFVCRIDSDKRTRCLADVLKPELVPSYWAKWVYVEQETAEAFTWDTDFEATRLLGTEKCFEVEDNDPHRLTQIPRVMSLSAMPTQGAGGECHIAHV